MGLPPFRPSRSKLLALLGDVLSVHTGADDNAKLRLRLIHKNISWQALIEFAQQQGALWPLIWALQQRSLLLPVPSPNNPNHPTLQLVSAYRHHLARRERQRDQLLAIIGALNRSKIETLLLKGARHLAFQPGDWAEARDMRDIDLLVHPEQAELAAETLANLGYSADDLGAPLDQHLPEMWRAGSPSVVEIHTQALAFSARKILPTDEVWQRAIRLSNEEADFLVMPEEWHLLHGILSHQISDRGHVRQVLAVKPLWEFTMFGRSVADRAWRTIANHMAARGHADVLGSWIVQAEQLYGAPRPPGVPISPAARVHAATTLANAVRLGWLRQASIIGDQFRFAFAKETLAVRYKIDPQDVSLATKARHLNFLRRYYRGRIVSRLFGSRSLP